MKIRKISQSSGLVANVVDNLESTSTKDGLSANQGRLLGTYSTDEVRIGTWMGKTLYRKVINVASPVKGTTTSVSSGVSNVEFMYIENAFIYKSDDGSCRPVMIADNSDATTDRIIVQAAPSGLAYYLGNKFQYFTNLYMIINYTKTTD